MLLIASVWSAIEVKSFGSTLHGLLENNHKNIAAAKSMKEALEREDGALLLLLTGNDVRGLRILRAADSLFINNFEIAKANITITGEDQLLNSINAKYADYKKLWDSPTGNDMLQNKLDWYSQNIHQPLLDLMFSIDNLISLNDNQLYSTALQSSERSRRALMPGVIALIAAVVFTFLFYYFINLYVINPMLEITKRLNKFMKERVPFDYQINTKDEISKLADTLNLLCSHLIADETKK
jgi:NtrC-family two-component system sensor histidine kinase KinB